MRLASSLAVARLAVPRVAPARVTRVAGTRRRARVRGSLYAALLAVAAAGGGCSEGDYSGWGRALGGGGGGRKRIGVALPTRGVPFYQELEAGIRDAARRERYELVVTDANMDAGAQAAQAAGLLAQRLDAIVIAPIDTLAIVPAVERANAARVPVFTVGFRPARGRTVSHVQSDHVGLGRIAATYLAAFLGGRGEVAVVTRRGIPALAEREEGFRAAMRAHRGITIVDSVDGGGAREQTLGVLEPVLRARRETDAVFAVEDRSALGAYDAAMARYRADLIIVGADPSGETLQLVQGEGPLKASLVQQPRRMGEQLIQLAVRHFDDEPVAPRVLVPTRLVNVDSLRAAGLGARRSR